MNESAKKSRNNARRPKKKRKKKRGSHSSCSKYLLHGLHYVFHAREQVQLATTDGQDMIRDIINHLSHVCVCVCHAEGRGNLGWLTSDGLTG